MTEYQKQIRSIIIDTMKYLASKLEDYEEKPIGVAQTFGNLDLIGRDMSNCFLAANPLKVNFLKHDLKLFLKEQSE